MKTEPIFDYEALHRNFRKGVGVYLTPGDVEFAGYIRGNGDDAGECESLMWVRTHGPVFIESTYNQYGHPTIRFADVELKGWGEDGDEGNIALRYPADTIEISRYENPTSCA